MTPFTRLTSIAASLPMDDVDTDIIFPAQFLLHTAKTGLGRYAFHAWRYDGGGEERRDFVLNQSRFRDAKILVCGSNFGCGSSREQAPWALHDLGVRCLIAAGFGEIFQANCLRNGILPIILGADDLATLHAAAAGGQTLTIDLVETAILLSDGLRVDFVIGAWARNALLNGWDEIEMIVNEDSAAIAAFEAGQRARARWLYARG